MGAGELSPVQDQSPRGEVFHQSERTRVTRISLPGRTVIRKEPLGADAERRLRHEAAMLERLRGVAGVAQLLEAPRFPGSLVLEDAGRMTLAGLAKPLPAERSVRPRSAAGQRSGGDAPAGGDAPGYQSGEPRDLRRR